MRCEYCYGDLVNGRCARCKRMSNKYINKLREINKMGDNSTAILDLYQYVTDGSLGIEADGTLHNPFWEEYEIKDVRIDLVTLKEAAHRGIHGWHWDDTDSEDEYGILVECGEILMRQPFIDKVTLFGEFKILVVKDRVKTVVYDNRIERAHSNTFQLALSGKTENGIPVSRWATTKLYADVTEETREGAVARFRNMIFDAALELHNLHKS